MSGNGASGNGTRGNGSPPAKAVAGRLPGLAAARRPGGGPPWMSMGLPTEKPASAKV